MHRYLGKDIRVGLISRGGDEDKHPPSVYKVRRTPKVR